MVHVYTQLTYEQMVISEINCLNSISMEYTILKVIFYFQWTISESSYNFSDMFMKYFNVNNELFNLMWAYWNDGDFESVPHELPPVKYISFSYNSTWQKEELPSALGKLG